MKGFYLFFARGKGKEGKRKIYCRCCKIGDSLFTSEVDAKCGVYWENKFTNARICYKISKEELSNLNIKPDSNYKLAPKKLIRTLKVTFPFNNDKTFKILRKTHTGTK